MNPLEEIKKEFGEYLREHWDERETLDVASWWIKRFSLILEEIEGEIEGMKKEYISKHDKRVVLSEEFHYEGFNKALEDIKTLIQEKIQ